MMHDNARSLGDDDGLPGTAGLMRLLIGLIGDEVSDYAQAVRPPEELRLAVRAAPTPRCCVGC